MLTPFSLTIHGLTIAGLSFGNPNKKPLLALHGWLDNAASFQTLAPLLDDFYILAIDFPGHGHSSHLPEHTIYHFVDALIYVHAIVEHFQWEAFALLGHSMGGAVASLFAGTFPEKLTHLAIIEGLGPLTEDTDTAVLQMRNYIQKSAILSRKYDRGYDTIMDAAKRRAAKGYLDLEHASLITERGIKKVDDKYYWRHDKKLLIPSPIRLTEDQVIHFLSQIAAPVCYIGGEKGLRYDKNKVARRRQAVKDLQIHHIPGGHHVHMEQPQAVANLLKDFLA